MILIAWPFGNRLFILMKGKLSNPRIFGHLLQSFHLYTEPCTIFSYSTQVFFGIRLLGPISRMRPTSKTWTLVFHFVLAVAHIPRFGSLARAWSLIRTIPATLFGLAIQLLQILRIPIPGLLHAAFLFRFFLEVVMFLWTETLPWPVIFPSLSCDGDFHLPNILSHSSIAEYSPELLETSLLLVQPSISTMRFCASCNWDLISTMDFSSFFAEYRG
ncbi:hypothetical protein Mapa_007915 [Marchantia paleacea]|nr:hypothetical protein Mapa_007915 [Marchantia paleacea]